MAFASNNPILYISTVKMNCGCDIQVNGSPNFVIAEAIKHVEATGHTVDIHGLIKSTTPKVKAYTPPFKFNKKQEVLEPI